MLTRRSFISLASTAMAVRGAAANWPQFRGPGSTGVPSDESGLPESWSDTENVAWKTSIGGSGWSSPVVWGDMVFLTTPAIVSEGPLIRTNSNLYKIASQEAGQP